MYSCLNLTVCININWKGKQNLQVSRIAQISSKLSFHGNFNLHQVMFTLGSKMKINMYIIIVTLRSSLKQIKFVQSDCGHSDLWGHLKQIKFIDNNCAHFDLCQVLITLGSKLKQVKFVYIYCGHSDLHSIFTLGRS